EYASGDSNAAVWTTLASGNTAVTNGLLGVFDPTLLLNGIYNLRLVATDSASQTTAASVNLIVNGQQKIGNFSVSFDDLNVPVSGLPIQIVRTYDSRDKRSGDFGFGWTLGIKNIRVEESGILGADWEQTQSGGFISTYCLQPAKPHFVTVTFPNGHVYKFQAVTTPQCSALTPIQSATVRFVPMPGTRGSLAGVGDNDVLVFGDVPGSAELRKFDSLELYDPSVYRLTDEDGTVFVIDQNLGVRSVTDTNGNVLTVNANGITHSSGKSILFTRDALGRITRITDPANNALTYAYNASGDLVSFTDRENNTTTFTYNNTHGLLAIQDPRGKQPLRNEYDDAGRLVRQIDAHGKAVTFSHEMNARQSVVTDRLGFATISEYDAQGNVIRIVDSQGNVTRRTFDANHNVLTETNALGQTRTYTYDSQDNKLSETDPLGNVTRYTYNNRRDVLTITDPKGLVTSYGHDDRGNVTSITDPSGKSTSITNNANGRPTSFTDARGNTSTIEYDASGNVIRKVDWVGTVSTYTYDANNNRLTESVTRTTGGQSETLITTYKYDRMNRQIEVVNPNGTTVRTAYDSIGNPTSTTDELGLRTVNEYDDMGRLTRIVHPDGKTETVEHDAEGRRTKSIDRAGRTTLYLYNSLGRLERTTHPDSTFTATTYDALGRIEAVTDENGQSTRYEYDAAGRRTKVTNALNNVTTFVYDANGNQKSLTDARGQVINFEYDANNRLIRTLFADGTSVAATYDEMGQVISKTDQAGRTMRYEYNENGKPTKITDPRGGTTTYTYDELGNLLTQTDANNHVTRYEYDRMGRRTKRTLPLGMSETYTYDVIGNLISHTNFLGRKTTYAYDEMNQLLSKTPDPASGEPAILYAYTPSGQRASMTDATGVTTYVYDAQDRLLSKQTPQGTLSYTYDAAGNTLTLRSSNSEGVSINYAYDNLNRLTTVTDNRLGGSTAYAYDPNGNLQSLAYQNQVRTSYTYDALNRLTNLDATLSGTTLASYAYLLGPAGNRLSVTEQSGRTVNYTYDELYRLTEERISGGDAQTAGQLTYAYDAVGNRLSRVSTVPGVSSSTSTFNANDQLESDIYDANGNTIGSNGVTYAYDSEDQLIQVNNGLVRYAYDGDGNRVAKTVGGVTTRYLVDTNNHTRYAQVVEELIGDSVTRQYTYGHDLISQRQRINGVWQASFYGYDGHGSVRYLTDSNGQVTDTYAYDAFGNLIARTGSTPNDYLYAGEQFDANVGFYYLRARYMNPASGRFWTLDTYEGTQFDPASLHKYLYAEADPANKLDPSGNMTTLQQAWLGLTIMGALMNAIGIVRSVHNYFNADSGVEKLIHLADFGLSLVGLALSFTGIGPATGAGGFAISGVSGGSAVLVAEAGLILHETRIIGAALVPVGQFIGIGGAMWMASKRGHVADYELRESNGRIVASGRIRSGGTKPGRRLTWPEQLLVHTERKIMEMFRSRATQSAIITIRGTKPPCMGPRGCNWAMQQYANEFDLKIIYRQLGVDKIWTYVKQK
ncbi:MAG TPA: RHS repeat-associated core domain-containing protein, partial [Pyrinomonadaceae bacterium]|nr:RHS repeat-associated core domain-containing protein [Pyrinomonadaceae bacterium]